MRDVCCNQAQSGQHQWETRSTARRSPLLHHLLREEGHLEEKHHLSCHPVSCPRRRLWAPRLGEERRCPGMQEEEEQQQRSLEEEEWELWRLVVLLEQA